MNKLNSKWFKAALIRAIRTICQTAASMIAVGSAISEVNWTNVISVSLVAGLLSILTSIGTGLPEARTDGEIVISESDDKDVYTLLSNGDPADWSNKSSVTLAITKAKKPDVIDD